MRKVIQQENWARGYPHARILGQWWGVCPWPAAAAPGTALETRVLAPQLTHAEPSDVL